MSNLDLTKLDVKISYKLEKFDGNPPFTGWRGKLRDILRIKKKEPVEILEWSE